MIASTSASSVAYCDGESTFREGAAFVPWMWTNAARPSSERKGRRVRAPAPADTGDARVVEVERVPLSSAVIRLRLDDDRVRRQLLDPGVWIAGEVAGVEVDAQPWRADGVVDPEQVLGPGGESPVVLEREHHSRPFRRGQAGLDRFDAPLESLVIGVSRQRWLVALDFHEVVEGGDRVPASRIQPDAGNAERAREVDAPL